MTIPNILSFVRILLIPCFAISFFHSTQDGINIIPVIILVISGLTDLLDGYIARKYNQVTDIGKILDPIADKLTQIIVCSCLAMRFKQLIILLIIYVLKELTMIIGGAIQLKKKTAVPQAKWFGKISIFELYLSMFLLLIFPRMDDIFVMVIVIISITLALFALFMYMIDFIQLNLIKGKTNDLQQM